MTLRDEIKQTKPFQSVAEEVVLNLLFTGGRVKARLEEVFKPFKIGATLYNILRILKGAGNTGRTCSEISERLLQKEPDITRLLDRLEKKKLAKRARDSSDRRIVNTYITKAGLEVIDRIAPVLNSALEEMASNLSKTEAKHFVNVMERFRENIPSGAHFYQLKAGGQHEKKRLLPAK